MGISEDILQQLILGHQKIEELLAVHSKQLKRMTELCTEWNRRLTQIEERETICRTEILPQLKSMQAQGGIKVKASGGGARVGGDNQMFWGVVWGVLICLGVALLVFGGIKAYVAWVM